MAYEGNQWKLQGVKAGADLTAAGNLYKFVKLTAAGTVGLCAAVTDKPVGVLCNRPNTGETADVVYLGVTKVQSDAAVTAGAAIGTSADGQAATYTVADTTKYIVGTALSTSTAAGGLITAMVDCINPRVLA